MKKEVKHLATIGYILTIILLIIIIMISGWWILDTMVSQKYETSYTNDCISYITGDNLCFRLKLLKGLVAICFIGIIVLILNHRKVLK
jgi:hypothetical protein